MGSALLDTTIEAGPAEAASTQADALRAQVAERLAAHRSRRGAAQNQPAPPLEPQPTDPRARRSARIAATVAERYAQSPSYRAVLAAEAERAVQQARAAAEIAARNAQAVAAAQQQMLDAFDQGDAEVAAQTQRIAVAAPAATQRTDEMQLWPEMQLPRAAAQPLSPDRTQEQTTDRTKPSRPFRPQGAIAKRRPSRAHEVAAPELPLAPAPTPTAGFTVRLYQDAASAARLGRAAAGAAATGPMRENRRVERNDAEVTALDEEIAFRQAPVFEEPAGPPMPLPANLIEFPRQLVASRKARPRYAEGPLRDEAEPDASDGQLRIFEVDPAQISTTPDTGSAASPTPQWTSIWLDAPASDSAANRAARSQEATDAMDADAASETDAARVAAALPDVAPVGRRALAAAINAGIVGTGLAGFAAAFALTTRHTIQWSAFRSLHSVVLQLAGKAPGDAGIQPALLLGALAGAAVLLYLLYQGLFFTLSHGTPGMRCARIALCTFDDENPTQSALRRRIVAVLLSACPMALGFLWAALDEERLAWHDRMTRMYMRSY
jgi:uncharacterized RDD family membrane protein YckC